MKWHSELAIIKLLPPLPSDQPPLKAVHSAVCRVWCLLFPRAMLAQFCAGVCEESEWRCGHFDLFILPQVLGHVKDMLVYSSSVQHRANHVQEHCHPHAWRLLAHKGWVLHCPLWVGAAILLWQLRLHSSALTYGFRQESAVWWKLCCCRHAPVVASDGQVTPTWAAVVPLCWFTPRDFCFSNVPSFQRRPVVQHWANTTWPNFTYSSTNILVTWCFYSRRIIMILSGMKLYL